MGNQPNQTSLPAGGHFDNVGASCLEGITVHYFFRNDKHVIVTGYGSRGSEEQEEHDKCLNLSTILYDFCKRQSVAKINVFVFDPDSRSVLDKYLDAPVSGINDKIGSIVDGFFIDKSFIAKPRRSLGQKSI